jgi:type IV secretion system protein VirB4
MVLSRTPRSSTVLNVDLKALGPLLTALGGGQAGLNAFGADYANAAQILEGMIVQ